MNEEIYNTDSVNIFKLLDNFKFNDEITSSFRRLNPNELNNIFRNSSLIRKIVTKFPKKAYSIGYTVVNIGGSIIEKNNQILLKAFMESSIRARIYGKCFCELKFLSQTEKPVNPSDTLTGYRIHNTANIVGDFFELNVNYSYKAHSSRVLPFYGNLNYQYNIDDSDYYLNDDYSDSIIQGLYNSFTDYIESNAAGKYILKNLSYLLIGIENLANMSKSDIGKQMVISRLTDLNENRNIGRTIAFDKKYEELQFISQTVSGFSEIVNELKTFFAAETEYPIEELFDKSSNQNIGSGIQNQLIARNLWSTKCNEWTLENWLDNYIKFYSNFYDMDKYSIQIPLEIEMSEQEKIEIQKTAAERDKILLELGVITAEEIRQSYKGETFTINLNIDSEPIPDDNYWENLANITIQDLDNLAEETIND